MMHADDACHIWGSITVYCIENDAIVIRAVNSVTLDISRSPIGFQWGPQKYPGQPWQVVMMMMVMVMIHQQPHCWCTPDGDVENLVDNYMP